MGSSRSIPDLSGEPHDGGFATPAAMIVSLAIATIAIAVQLRTVAALHASQADYLRAVAELKLDGAEMQAAAALASGAAAADGRWTLQDAQGAIEVRAEPETPKFAYGAPVDPQLLGQLGAAHLTAVQTGLARLAAEGEGDPDALRALDPSPLWRACAPRLFSAYGQNLGAEPSTDTAAGQARPGQVWRIQVRDGWGWTQVRTVRFLSGAASARVIYRSVYRDRPGEPPCPTGAAAPA